MIRKRNTLRASAVRKVFLFPCPSVQDGVRQPPASAKADAVLIVEKKHQSRFSEIRKMAEALQINQANVRGCIVL